MNGRLFLVLLCGWISGVSTPAYGAEVTRVLDAFDSGKAWDGAFGVRFVHTRHTARIVREWICQVDDNTGQGVQVNPLCPGGNTVLDTRQLQSEESINVLNLDFRAGLYHDLEFYLTLPIVVGWQSSLSYDDGVGAGNSLVDSPYRPSLFSVSGQETSRAGLGDLTLGLRIAPFHADRDPLYPSWVLGVEYQAPTAAVRQAGNSDGVGSGLHALTLWTAISRRVLPWAEPYFRFSGILRFPSRSSPFQNERVTQTLVSPGHSLGLRVGAEFYPWRIPSDDGQYVSVDMAFTADFTFEGREFTELFDALGTSDCDPATNCHRTALTRGERTDLGTPRKTDGVTDVEQYGRFGLQTAVVYQALANLRLRLGFNYWHTTSHFITFADAGKDLDGQNNVEHDNSDHLNEYNPFYNESYDDFGKRFRVDDKNSFEVVFSVEGQI